jgi:hypothetical protein
MTLLNVHAADKGSMALLTARLPLDTDGSDESFVSERAEEDPLFRVGEERGPFG